MKKTIVSTNRLMILAMMMVMTISANAARPLVACYQRDARMSYNAAKNEALFLSDKMAYELNLTAAQYEAVYEINLDYLMSLNGHADVFGIWWDRRNADLRYVLNSWQYDKYVALSHFYRPVAWKAGSWTFAVYSHYNRGRFYNDRPTVFVTYKGGNNRRDVRFYADRKVTKPAVHHANNVPAKVNKSSNGSTWRNTGNTSRPATTTKPNGHSNGNRQIAMNTNNNRSGSGHFGGRR